MIFNKNIEQTSNDYYEAYKAELVLDEEENKLFSLNNFLKLEILAVAVGFFMMNQQTLTSEYQQFIAGKEMLPVSEQYANLDKELIVTQEDDVPEKVAIREDDVVVGKTDKEALVDNSDLQLLIELLKSEMKENEQTSSNNRIIISQN